jgi:hypothetical protein
MNVKIYDEAADWSRNETKGNGYVEQTIIDLRSVKFPPGIYLLSQKLAKRSSV